MARETMADFSDDDAELTLIPDTVAYYHFVDEDDAPISFVDLPYESPDPKSPLVYLHGSSEDKLLKVYQLAKAWKLELSRKIGPEVFVLLDEKWVKLLNPRKSYEEVIRSILITIQALHFLRWNPDSSEKNMWDNLRRAFNKFEVRPSEDDLRPHTAFMQQFVQKEETLANSQILKAFLEGKGRRRTEEGISGAPEVKQPFIAKDDEVEEMRDAEGGESDEDDDLFDSVCSICDNGGDLLCCEGECMRSFHATKEAGVDSTCASLGFTGAQVEAIQNFLCKNCKMKQHQCFACGKLGNSDKNKGAEVFQCSNATCGYFYHPKCVAKLLYPDEEAAASECEKTVLDGRFVCPYHRCTVCKQLEVKSDPDLQFAICRRCPKSYHRKCLPRKISFTEDRENGIKIRAWEDLLPNCILIYCLKHKIDAKLLTPIRDHIVFPRTGTAQESAKVRSSEELSHKQKPPIPKRHQSPMTTSRETSPADRQPPKKRAILSEEVPSSKGRDVGDPSQLGKGKDLDLRKVKKLRKTDLTREEVSRTAVACSRSLGAREVAAGDPPSYDGNIEHSSFPPTNASLESKMKEFLEKESSSVTIKDVRKRQTIPLTHQSGGGIDKVTPGKIERSVEALKTAYQRINNGGSVDDAKAVCEPEVVKQVAKWHRKLGVYLSPFLHGMRYTSFGRHFTKEDKLEEICGRLQWYVQTDDTIVDFCCGSNDFSRIMKEKMDTMGKRCNFKNFDIVPPKDDFCFEKRDWMTVQRKELPDGASLIMGLNPPFGTKAGLANKFIDKALTFKPKLIILIVPKETERLDQKQTPCDYDLVWADNVTLSGMSFYLPGSVDVNDKKMEQWNVNPPLLYLWSRSDWTARHKAIAEEHGHFSNLSQDMLASPPVQPPPSIGPQEAEDIISLVVGDISGINNEMMEIRQEDDTSRKGKEKVDPGPPHEVECGVKTGSTVLKQKEGKEVGAGTTAINEVKKVNDRNQEKGNNGSVEGTVSHREARGIRNQNEGNRSRADQYSGARSSHKEARVIRSHYDGTVQEPRNVHTDNGHHNEATRNHQGAGVLGTYDDFRETGPHRIGKVPDVQDGGSYNNIRSSDTRDIKSMSPDMRSASDHPRTRSPPGITETRFHKMRQSEDRAARNSNNADVSNMDISFSDHNRQYTSAIRGDNTAALENNDNPSRYDSRSNRGNNTLQRDDNNIVSEDMLPLAGYQYINNASMEQPIEMRQLEDDFSDLAPILNNGNDLSDMARQYPYNWETGSVLGTGSGSFVDNRARVQDYGDPKGLDDYEPFVPLYGSHDENRPDNFGAGAIGHSSSIFHNGTSLPSYGLSGHGGSMSTSALDRYAPRLDETNFSRPGNSLGFSGGSHQVHQSLGGYGGLSGPPPHPYNMHGLDRRDMPAPHHPNHAGFGARQQHPFQPPNPFQPRPGSSGGWLYD
ncbi:Protein ENHANCED DOWNY MILDEW 2 [Rhynchospora pubera]|uniref:Protein ENHANCED DOWNY MILDEW 2 n=1 Tax=Rhynchospora pubera TaxID=906938 RepID=A0AAV8HE75_9POAL|nr:Protein ENHANCED DOWNY MILDEW 2 [Rhynchospora pubera]